ncbi:MAG: c-type cytochrome [Planctomycetota bacterium]|nr:c-type cytochrome [Planctomycetota bacterium]
MHLPIRSTLAFLLLLISAGCQGSSAEPQTLSREQLYRLHCSGCHGDGSGNGHIAGTLAARPRNLKHNQWQDSVTDEHIFRVIHEGGEAVKLNKAMPAFEEKLTKEEIRSLVGYIRFLGR